MASMFLRKSDMLAVLCQATSHPTTVIAAFIASTSPSSFCNRAAYKIRSTSTSSSIRGIPQTARFPTTDILVSSRLATVPSSIPNPYWTAPAAIAAGGRRRTRSFVDMMARGGRGGRGGSGASGRNGNRADRVGDSYAAVRAGQHRSNVSPGISVEVVQKQHQRTGQLTAGVVSRLLTNSAYHPRGIKVMLSGGIVGRVQHIRGGDNEHLSAATTRSGLSPNVEGGFFNMGDTSCENSDDLAVASDGVFLPSTIGMSGIASTATIGTGRRRLQRTLSTTTSTGRATTTTTTTATSPIVTSPTTDRRNRTSTVNPKTTTTGSAGANSGSPGVRAPAPAVATTVAAVSPAPPVLPQVRRELRAFRAERVQGRSWSLGEGGELVVTGEGGEELEGKGSAMVDDSAVFREGRNVRRGGRGRGGRGRR